MVQGPVSRRSRKVFVPGKFSMNLSAPSVPQGPSICVFQDLDPLPLATDPLRVHPPGFGTNVLIL